MVQDSLVGSKDLNGILCIFFSPSHSHSALLWIKARAENLDFWPFTACERTPLIFRDTSLFCCLRMRSEIES